jgi:LemA protein
MDPSSAERIDRMESDGRITARQADMLRSSVSPGAPRREGTLPRRSRGLLWLTAGLIVLAVAVSIAILQPGGGPAEVQDVSEVFNQSDVVGAMNRSLMTALVVILFVAVGAGMSLWTYNGLVNREEQVFSAWGQVESNLQRRSDLTPQLVETVSRYLRHERETLENVTQARSQDFEALQSAIEDLAKGVQQSAAQLQRSGQQIVEDEESLIALSAAQARMDRSIHTLIATAEAYPELRSSDQFLELQAQFEGTENRLNVTRMRFNELVGEYNAAIRRVPGALVAGAGSFRRKAYFQAEGEARNAPELAFD